MSALLKNLKFAWNYFFLGEHRRVRDSSWVAPPQFKGQLWFGNVLVANLHQMFSHQGTWCADYDLRIRKDSGELEDQVLAYMSFCEYFDRRIAEGCTHDFDEFEWFAKVASCTSWTARLPSGQVVPMEGRLWFADGGVNWQHPETKPSTEAAANEFWSLNAVDAANISTEAEQGAAPNP